MKTIKIIFTLLLSLILLFALVTFILIKTVDINKYKSQIVKAISDNIGRQVDIGALSFKFSIMQGIVLRIYNLSIADHPNFSTDNFFSANLVYLNVDLISFITERKINVSNIEIKSPEINIVKNKNNELNFTSFTNETNNSNSSSNKEDLNISSTNITNKTSLDNVLINTINISNATVNYVDNSSDPSISIPFKKVNINISDFSFKKPFAVNATCSLWSDKTNISFKGLANIDLINQKIRFDNLNPRMNLSDFSFKKINNSIPILNNIGIKDEIRGILKILVSQFVIGKEGLLVLSLESELIDGELSIKNMKYPIENIDFRLEASENNVNLKELLLYVASGKVSVSGGINDYMKDGKYQLNINLEEIKLDELIPEDLLPAEIEGKLYGNFSMNGKGFDEESIKNNLTGEGRLEVREGKILDVNVLKIVLSKIPNLPYLIEEIEKQLPELYKEKLTKKDTIINKVILNIIIKDNFINFNNSEIEADGFLLQTNGKLDFNQHIYSEAKFFIPKELSTNIISSVEELSSLLDDDSRLNIPLTSYNGKLSNFVMYPDFKEIGKKIIKKKGKEELKNIIFKALDIDQTVPKESSKEESEEIKEQQTDDGVLETPDKTEESPEGVLIEGILDSILK